MQIYDLPFNNCFRYRKILQNGVKALPKVVLKNSGFLRQKKSNFCTFSTIRFASNFASTWSKYRWNNVWRDLRLPVSAFATVAWKSFIDIYDRSFYVTTTDVDIGNLKSLHTLCHKYLDHMLVKFIQNRLVRNIQNFVLCTKKMFTHWFSFLRALTPFWRTFLDINNCSMLK